MTTAAPVEVESAWTTLADRVAEARAGSPLARITILVPTPASGLDAVRRRARELAQEGNPGLANTRALTVDQLATEIFLVGDAARSRKPLTPMVRQAAVAGLLAQDPGRFDYCADRPAVKGGRWVTTWDGRTHTSATTVQIDHTVPVHEAWGSGARTWTKAKRVAFYNDLGDHRTLNAQTSALNSAKQAKGPEAWLPAKNRCGYLGEWVAVKHRWGLKVDKAEKTALTRLAASCPNVTIKVAKA